MPRTSSSASRDVTTTSQSVMKRAVKREELLGLLNTAQRRVVEAIEGPVMVVAGPGTGKTHVLALRIANILDRTQMNPGNILCLTFSTSAATQMRERLRRTIGSEAYGVTVRNFHSFCSELIAEHPLVFDEWSALEQISDVERYRELNKIIDQLLPDLEIVNPKSPYGRTRDILSRISQLKREGVTEEQKLRVVIAEYRAQMEAKSKEGTKAHEKNVLSAQKFEDLVEIFLRYQSMLQQTQRFDYDDMILFVIEALKQHDWLLQSLQERYQYVLVDEFQDTNGAQYRLVELLTTYEHLDHDPNLFVVGDDDQAIYRFQGANLANIMKFTERFPQAEIIPLTESYRCTQEILDAAGSLIAHNTERLVGRIDGLEKNLSSATDKHGPVPRLLRPPSDMTESVAITQLVIDRLEKGISPDEIAILTQTNAELSVLYDVLNAHGIPVTLSGKVDLLKEPLVQQAVALLRAVENPENSAHLADALACTCFGCHPADLGRLYERRRDDERTLLSVLLELESSDLTLANRDAILHARDVLLDLHNKEGSRTVVDTLEHLLKDSGLLQTAQEHFDTRAFATLQEFFDRLKYRAYEQPHFSFKTFLSDLDYYGNPDYGELRLSYSLPHLTTTGVHLMTAHQSKGLEFSTVILSNFRDGHWDKRRNPASVSVPEDMLFGWEKDDKSYLQNQDERRLCYVAMTRAKDELVFVCPQELTSGDKSREVSPSAFFAESGDLPEETVAIRDPEKTASLLLTPVRDLDEEMKAFLLSRIENFSLSVTALNHFLEDPQKFVMIDLLRVPQAKQANLVYGNAVHDALKAWGLKRMEGDTLSRDAFVDRFEWYLRERELLTDAERANLIKVGRQALPRYYEQSLENSTAHIMRIEFPIQTHFGDIPIKGHIDRIDRRDPDSSVITVIDYKTGKPKSENAIRSEDYFRQLVFYALLIEQKKLPVDPEAFVLEFIGEREDHPVSRIFQITTAELDELKKVVEAVWAKILVLDFTPLGS